MDTKEALSVSLLITGFQCYTITAYLVSKVYIREVLQKQNATIGVSFFQTITEASNLEETTNELQLFHFCALQAQIRTFPLASKKYVNEQ